MQVNRYVLEDCIIFVIWETWVFLIFSKVKTKVASLELYWSRFIEEFGLDMQK